MGGDTTTSRSGLVLSVTVLGKVPKALITYRNTAQPNDVLCVTGDLGAAYLGLQLLEREKQVFLADPNMQPNLSENGRIWCSFSFDPMPVRTLFMNFAT